MITALQTNSKTAINHINESALADLKSRFRGQLLRPDDPGYDEARKIWNGMIDKRPALIARCTGAADVVEAVKFARSQDLLLAVRSGGHNVAGNALVDGGLVIDLSGLKGVHVNPVERTARVQPGCNWGDVDRETQLFGLATPGGIVSLTGVAGLTLGGGFGWLTRKHGFTCDNLLSVDLVTAEGEFITASETENSELFWGIRGGGGNFGVVTSLKFRLHPVGPKVTAGMIVYPLEQARPVLTFLREYAAAAPDNLTTMAFLRLAPPAPFLPKEIHGRPVVGVAVCHTGPLEEGARLVQPLKDFGRPLADLIGAKPYTAHQTLFDAGQQPGPHYYWKSEYLPGLSDEAINTAIGHAANITSPLTGILIFQLGGAASRVDPDATAAAHREAAFVLNINTSWREPAETDRHVGWARNFWKAMRPFSTGGVYVNFLSADEGQDRVRAAYGSAKYERLVALKRKYDPTNFFQINQNINPA
jgi:FAD/FMN-containing dehydrogenase